MRLGFVNVTHYLHGLVKFPKAERIFKLIGLYATGKIQYIMRFAVVRSLLNAKVKHTICTAYSVFIMQPIC